jgi:sugar-phosphatase
MTPDRTQPGGAEALLLDLDGTLVDSEPINEEAYGRFFAAKDWPHPPQGLRLFTGRRAEDVFASEAGPWEGQDPQQLLTELLTHYPRDPRAQVLPGARDLIERAADGGVLLALVTSANAWWAHRCLRSPLEAADRFSVVVTADDVVKGKPDPSGFRLACSELDVPAARVVAVEDSPAGVRAARGAGVGFVYAVASTHPAELLHAAGAHMVVANLDGVVLTGALQK